jgi:hypothetical protein
MMMRITLPQGAIRVPPPRYAPAHFGCSWAGSGALLAALSAAALVWWRRRELAGRGRVVAGGTFLLVVGVVAVVWDVADDIVRGGLWEASISDAAMIGVAVASVGAMLILATRSSSERTLV